MFVDRTIPNGVKIHTLTSNSGEFGMVNLGGELSEEISKIDKCNEIFIENDKVIIYFPAWDYFYRDEIFSKDKNGFTLGDIIKHISHIGYVACGESWVRDKTLFTECCTTFESAATSVGEFALCDFKYTDNAIYASVDD